MTPGLVILLALTGAGAVSTLAFLLAADRLDAGLALARRSWVWVATHEQAVGATLAVVVMAAALGCMVVW